MQLIFQHRARIATLPASNHYILLGALQGPTHCNAVINTQHRNPEQEERPNSVSSLSALHTKKKEGPTNTPSNGPTAHFISCKAMISLLLRPMVSALKQTNSLPCLMSSRTTPYIALTSTQHWDHFSLHSPWRSASS